MNRIMHRGATLVELMVAMVIGIFLLGATYSVYLSNKNAYRTSNIVSRMQENGRIALHVIVNDLRMTGFMGNNTNPDLMENRGGTASQLDPVPGGCGGDGRWHIDMNAMLTVGDNQAPVVDGTSFAGNCLAGTGLANATDVIALKRAATGTIDDDDTDEPDHAGWTLARTDLVHGAFFIGGETIPGGFNPATASNRRWLAHVYYIDGDDNDNIPKLRRIDLGGGPGMTDNELVRGVQDLQIQLGVDTDGDGAPNRFVQPNMTGSAGIVAARIWLLMRAETPEFDHDDSVNTYEYAAKNYVPGSSDNETEIAGNPKQYRRLLLSATVTLRNLH